MDDLNERMDLLIEEVQNDPDHDKRLYSKTFWGQLKIKKRTAPKIEYVNNYLTDHGITVSTEYHEFGKEPKEEWLTLQYWPIPYPEDDWFTNMSTKVFENEQEVDVFFLTPLFKALGYQEEDFTFEYKVDITNKAYTSKERRKSTDLALFDGTDRAYKNLLVVCEAKVPDKPNSKPRLKNLKRAEKDLEYYQLGASTSKRFVATNADIIKVFRRGVRTGEGNIVLILELHRSVLKENWHALYLNLGKPILVGEMDV